MKRKLSVLSEEYCISKKLPVLDMPDLSHITSKSELNVFCLKEQNKYLAVTLELHRLKQAELSKSVNEYQLINSKFSTITMELKNAMISLVECLITFGKELSIDFNFNLDDLKGDIQNVIITHANYIINLEIDILFSTINSISIEVIQTKLISLRDLLFDLVKHLLSSIHSNKTSNGTLTSNGSNTVDMLQYQQQLKNLESQVQLITQKYDCAKMKLQETLEDMDIFRHKIYLMHDRYEEKLESLEEATAQLNKEKTEFANSNVLNQVQNLSKAQPTSNVECSIDTNIRNEGDADVSEMSRLLDEKSDKLNQLQSNYEEILNKYDHLNHNYTILKTNHQLLEEIPISKNPDYKLLLEKNNKLTQDNTQLREYLEFFWDILTEIKNVIRDNATNFQETISNHIGLLIENIKQLEVERDGLRIQGLQDSMLKQRYQEEIKQINENIEELTNINTTLRNQNNFYSTHLRKEKSDEDPLTDDEIVDNMTEEELRTKLKQQNNLIKQLRAEQETFIAEMEITAQSYEETFDQNSSLLEKLKEKQNSNLRLSSDLFKCNQSIQLLNSRLTNFDKLTNYNPLIERHSSDLSKRLEEVDLLRSRLESSLNSVTFNKNKDPNIDQVKEQLSLKQYELEANEIKLVKIVDENSNLKTHLENSNRNSDLLKSDIEKLEKQLDDKKKSLDLLASENATSNNVSADIILNEQIRMYKSKLTCACCNSNPINAIIYKCFHLFCHECLQVRYDTRQRKCPNCNMTFGLNDFHRVYF